MTVKNRIPKTFEEALAAFEALERELKLPHWIINGIYVWRLLRLTMFSMYLLHLGLMKEAHPEVKRLRKSKFKKIFDFLKLLLLHNPFLMAGQFTQRIVITRPRKHSYDGRLLDPTSYPVWRPPHDQTAMVLDNTNPLNPTPLTGAASYKLLERFGSILALGVWIRFDTRDRCIIKVLSKRLLGLTNQVELEIKIKNTLTTFIGQKSVFTAFFKWTRPSYLYLVTGQGKQAAIASARHLGINVVEFQHGVIGRGHLNYDFKDWESVPYFPDRLLSFGTYWFKDVHFPKSCSIDPVGYSFIEEMIAESKKKIARYPRQLLVLSQGTIADQILCQVASFCALRPEWRVIIRPHPNENPAHLRKFMSLKATTNNWVVEKGPSLQDHAAASAVAFGAYSTALIEALLAGCRIAFLDVMNSGIFFDGLIREGHAVKVKNGEELAQIINDLPDGNARGYFAKPVDDIVARVEHSHCGG